MKEHLKNIVYCTPKTSGRNQLRYSVGRYIFLFVFLFSLLSKAQSSVSAGEITIIGDAIMVVAHEDGNTTVFSAIKNQKQIKSSGSKPKRVKKVTPAIAAKKEQLPEKIATTIKENKKNILITRLFR